MTEPAMDSCDPDELEAKVAKARRILRDSGNLLKKFENITNPSDNS